MLQTTKLQKRIASMPSNRDVINNALRMLLQVVYINVYGLFDPCGTLSFLNLLVAMRFKILPNVFCKPISVSTSVSDSVVVKRVY